MSVTRWSTLDSNSKVCNCSSFSYVLLPEGRDDAPQGDGGQVLVLALVRGVLGIPRGGTTTAI
jgi:hypothetical protein